jgi:D-glycero-alpha-D-manno-heptose-7-phosphate kinase
MKKLRWLAGQAVRALQDQDWASYGGAMKVNTEVLKDMDAGLVSSAAEDVIDIAQFGGAMGWKVNGAGGNGGSVTILTDGDLMKKRALEREIGEQGYRVIPIRLAREGLRVWGRV